jgi:hypothetical protein
MSRHCGGAAFDDWAMENHSLMRANFSSSSKFVSRSTSSDWSLRSILMPFTLGSSILEWMGSHGRALPRKFQGLWQNLKRLLGSCMPTFGLQLKIREFGDADVMESVNTVRQAGNRS